MVRFLSSLFVAMALFLSPLAMVTGAAMAMPHAAAPGDHCAGSEIPSDDGKSSLELSCASSCAIYLPVAPSPAGKAAVVPPKRIIANPQLLAGIHPEGETPPPRMTPEI